MGREFDRRLRNCNDEKGSVAGNLGKNAAFLLFDIFYGKAASQFPAQAAHSSKP